MVEQLNGVVVAKVREKKVIRGKKLRVDTAVVAADIHRPADAGLLADEVRVISWVVQKIKRAGVSLRQRFTNRGRTAKKRRCSS